MRAILAIFSFYCLIFVGPTNAMAGWGFGWISNGQEQIPYYVYKSDNFSETPQRVLLTLHGCTQSGLEFANNGRLVELADQHNYLIIAPEQTRNRNTFRCWNWFKPAHQSRGSGEPSLFIGVLERVFKKEQITDLPIYVVGFSAGAAMAVVMNSCFPEKFAGAVAVAGLPFKAANSVGSAFIAMSRGSRVNPLDSAKDAIACSGSDRTSPLFLIHGEQDRTVNPVNSEKALEQTRIRADLVDDGSLNGSVTFQPVSEESRRSEGGMDYLLRMFENTNTQAVYVWHLAIEGLDHSWSGGSQGSHMNPSGPPAHLFIQRFIEEIESSNGQAI